jgi:hypothetical protein
MAEPTLYERLGGIFAIAAVVDNFSDRLLRNPKIVDANPELHEWHTVTYHTRLPGLKWGRTLWLASLAGGPFEYTGREMRDAHFDLKSHPRCSTKSLRNSPTPWMSFRCPSARSKRSWPASPVRRAKLPPVPSPELSTGAAGVEPGVIPAANSTPGTAEHDAAQMVATAADAERSRDTAKLISA